MMGVYCIHNIVNDKIYIGSSANLQRRFKNHKNMLDGNRHNNVYLQNSYNKYSADAFDFLVLEEVNDKHDLLQREQYWINNTKCYDFSYGYNRCPIAGSNIGLKWSKETKQKVSNTLKGKYAGENHPMYGRKHSSDSIIKMKKSHIGKSMPDKTRQKISNTLKGQMAGDKNPMYGKKGDKHHFYGKSHTTETIEKISKAISGENNHNYGNHFSEDHRIKISKAQAGEKGYHAKLKEKDAVFILSNVQVMDKKYSNKELSDIFNVSTGCIADIGYRRTWKYINPMSISEFCSYEKELKGVV